MASSKVTVLLTRDEFERLTAYCDQKGFKKSTLIARLVRDHLDGENFVVQKTLPMKGLEEK
jgi:hypothetical protein